MASNYQQILTLYAQRPIVEKHAKYAFYHPFAEALASMLCELPSQIGSTIVFDLILYFMSNLRRTPGHFFVFFLFSFVCTLTMSMYFRSIASLSRTLSQVRFSFEHTKYHLTVYVGYGTGCNFYPSPDNLYWIRNSNDEYASLV
jgi:ATP-binding cassette subfamily G (WHITE) protein 2 (PDR)